MEILYTFDALSGDLQQQAQARFLGAAPGDNFAYRIRASDGALFGRVNKDYLTGTQLRFVIGTPEYETGLKEFNARYDNRFDWPPMTNYDVH